MSIRLWSTTAASNNASPPNGAPEGMAPSGVNNTIRQIMAEVRDSFEDLPWFDYGHTPTRVDNDTFTVATDLTALYTVGRRLQLIGATTGYCTISSSSYSAPDTTVNVTMDSGNVPTSLTNILLGADISTGAVVPYFKRTAAEIAASVTPANYSYDELDLRRYGGAGDDSTDNSTPLTNALLVSAQNDGVVRVSTGTWRFNSAIVFGGTSIGTRIVGDGKPIFKFIGLSSSTDCIVANGGSTYRQIELRNIRINCNSVGRDGLVINFAERPILNNVDVLNTGRDALVLSCSSTNFVENGDFDIYIGSAGRHGIRMELSGSGGAYINENLWRQVEIRGVSTLVNSGRAIFCTSTASGGGSKFSNQIFLKSNFDAIYATGATFTPSTNVVEIDSGTIESWRFLSAGWENTSTGTLTGGYCFAVSGTGVWAGLTVDSIIMNSGWGNLGIHASVSRVWSFDFSFSKSRVVGPLKIVNTDTAAPAADVSGNTTSVSNSDFRAIRTGSAVNTVGQGACVLIGNDTGTTYGVVQEYSGELVIYTYSGGAWGERFRALPTGGVRIGNGAALYTVTGGAPSGGSNGDFAFRQDGGAGTSIYMKRAGSWVGIV